MNIFGINISRAKKKDSLDIAQWAKGNDTSDNTGGASLSLPYSQSAWVYIAVSVLAENIAQIPFRIARVPATGERALRSCRGEARANLRKRILGENIVESGAVVDLFEKPHPVMDRSLFWEMAMTWRSLRGEFFVFPLDKNDMPVDLATSKPKVSRMLTIDPAQFWHMVSGFELTGWRFTGAALMAPIPSQVLLPSEVVHSRTPNPYLFWRGLSPLMVASLPAESDYAAEQFMKGLMINNADTGVIVTTEQQASPEQRETIVAALRERKRKAGTADRPLFLWGGAKLEKPIISSADMQFLEHRNLNRREIGAIFKVPESLMGFTERNQSLGGGGAQEQERLAFMETTLAPHCRRLESAVDPIIKTFGMDLCGYFDMESLPVMQEARRSRIDAATKAFALGVPFNEINNVYDLGFGDLVNGDKSYLPYTLQEIGADGTPPQPTPPADATQNDPNNAKDANPFARLLMLTAPRPVEKPPEPQKHVCRGHPEFEASIAGAVKAKAGKLRKFFLQQKNRLLSNLPKIMKQFELAEGGESWLWKQDASSVTRGIDDLLNLADEDAALLKALKPTLIADLEHGGSQLWKEIGRDNFALPPAEAIAYLDKRKNVISGINSTTWDKLKSSLQEGLAAGETMDELAGRIKTSYQGINDHRADTIALTETAVATNKGRNIAMQMANVPRKGWVTSHLENTRTSHLENEQLSEAENGIPFDEPWPNGCMFPGDPEAEAAETVNCRCVGIAILDEGGKQ